VHKSAIAEPLSIDNALWADTVVASGSVIAVVLHTGKHTRSVMNTSNPGTKVGCSIFVLYGWAAEIPGRPNRHGIANVLPSL